MAFFNNPFSLPALFDHLHVFSLIEGGTSTSISLPELSSYDIAIREKHLLTDVFNFMTNDKDVVLFKHTISKLDRTQLQRMVYFLTSDSDYFFPIITNQFGPKHVQNLLGKSDDLDALFCEAIRNCFLRFMTNKYASHIVIRAMVGFNKEKKTTMYEHILFHALDIACDKHGCIALINIITHSDNKMYKDEILEFIAHNALFLSNNDSGNHVVQHVLQLDNSSCTNHISHNLSGHCVELSFKKYGSYIMEKLLMAGMKTMVVVVVELLESNVNTLISLARNEFGNFVVGKALNITKEMSRIDLFIGLVNKLMPFLVLLRRSSHSSNIAKILVTSHRLEGP